VISLVWSRSPCGSAYRDDSLCTAVLLRKDPQKQGRLVGRHAVTVQTASGGDETAKRSGKRHWGTSWEALGYSESPTSVTKAFFSLGGDASDATVMKVHFPPDHEVAAHQHNVDYCEVILAGSQCVGRTWYEAGDIRIAKADSAYGPLISGPEGVTILLVFNGSDWPHVDIRPLSSGGR
jgi:hypothetical protein